MAAAYEDCYDEAIADIVTEIENETFTITVKTLAGIHYIVNVEYEEPRFHFGDIAQALHMMDPESFPAENLGFMNFYTMDDGEVIPANPNGLQEGDFLTVIIIDTRPFCQYCEQHFYINECANWSRYPYDRCRDCEVHGHHHMDCPADY